MRLELVSISTDTAPLDALVYEPDGRSAEHAVLLMHGNVGNFYSGPLRWLPEHLVAMGYACLAFNRRGHDILVNMAGREASGGAFQTAAEGVADNDYAAAFMAARGYTQPVVIGHSNGGLLAACFAATHLDISALVLLSAHAGGADTFWRSCAAGLMAAEDGPEYAARARSMVAEGRGSELMLLPRWWYAITAASFVDRMDNTPDLLAAAPSISCPSLAIRGGEESPEAYPMEQFAQRTSGPAAAHVIAGSNHWYTGHEASVTDVVTKWLKEAVR